jgi:hypothetical protein
MTFEDLALGWLIISGTMIVVGLICAGVFDKDLGSEEVAVGSIFVIVWPIVLWLAIGFVAAIAIGRVFIGVGKLIRAALRNWRPNT